MGVATDYVRLDFPAPSRQPQSFKGLCDSVCGFPACLLCLFIDLFHLDACYTSFRYLMLFCHMQQPWARSSTLPDNMRGFEMKPRQLKLDSRFIMDVNVMDGTLMAPSTPFTKIWRLRNSGTIVWPQGTKLVWIGGDKLSASLSIDLQVLISNS